MGVEVFNKDGQTSKKDHGGKGQKSMEYYKRMYDPCPALGGGPEAFDRKYDNNYRKTALPNQSDEMEY